jgi:hypothetical protein
MKMRRQYDLIERKQVSQLKGFRFCTNLSETVISDRKTKTPVVTSIIGCLDPFAAVMPDMVYVQAYIHMKS